MNKPLIVASNIQRAFPVGPTMLRVLRGVDLTVGAGEFLAVMGKSGSGKSTLLHILGALDVPQDGQVVFDDEPIFPPPKARRFYTTAVDVLSASERRRIMLRRYRFGFVFQFYHLLPELNVLENVLLPRMIGASMLTWLKEGAAARKDALEVLERVGLADRLKHRPNQLSGGERQRVALARALAPKPSVLLADEPTGNLDAESGRGILDLLSQLNSEGQTIVMVTHDPSIATLTHRVLHLKNGRLVDAPVDQ